MAIERAAMDLFASLAMNTYAWEVQRSFLLLFSI